MIKILFLLLLSIPCFASGPKYNFSDPKLNDEMNNVYHDINNVLKGDIRGVTNGSSACAGCIGEYLESYVLAVNVSSSVYTDVTTIPLTPGDWDVSVLYVFLSNGANWTLTQYGISTGTAGNTWSDSSVGSNRQDQTLSSSFGEYSGTVSNWNVSTTTSVTTRAKLVFIYSSGGPVQVYAKLSARRVR